MKIIKPLLLILLSLFISSCTYDEMIESLSPEAERQFAEDYLTKLRQGDFEYIKSQIDEELISQVNDQLLQQLSGMFRTGNLVSTSLIGVQINVVNGVWQGNFTFEYKFDNGYNLANTSFRKVNDRYKVIGINVYQTDMSQKDIHVFTLSNKSALHYIILSLAILIPIFIIVSTYYCAKTPIPKRKWLWVLFVLVGVFSVHINWTSGEFGFQPLSFMLLGAAATADSPYSPWIISAAFPLGAIMFWIKRKKFIELARND